MQSSQLRKQQKTKDKRSIANYKKTKSAGFQTPKPLIIKILALIIRPSLQGKAGSANNEKLHEFVFKLTFQYIMPSC